MVGTSRKPDERRLPIHPAHIERIDAGLRRRMFFEHGYARSFGVADERLSEDVAGLRSREQLMVECDVVLLPKPVAEDLRMLPRGKVLRGWPHCIQDEELTQVAIDRRLTLVAWEAMNHWTHEGDFSLHVFHKNNELAGYCSVIHAPQLIGTTGAYGRRLRAAVISFGATARGAVTALFALGVHDVNVLTHRGVAAVAAPIAPARLIHYERDPEHPHRAVSLNSQGSAPIAELLADHDIVVNCILQDTDDPLMFVTSDELNLFAPGNLFNRRLLRRGYGRRMGAANLIRRANAQRRNWNALLRRRPQPVAPLELGDLGDQRSANPLPRHRHDRRGGVGCQSHDPPRDRDPRGCSAEPEDPLISIPLPFVPPRNTGRRPCVATGTLANTHSGCRTRINKRNGAIPTCQPTRSRAISNCATHDRSRP